MAVCPLILNFLHISSQKWLVFADYFGLLNFLTQLSNFFTRIYPSYPWHFPTLLLISTGFFGEKLWSLTFLTLCSPRWTLQCIVVARIISFLCSYPMLQHSDMEGEMAQVKQWVKILGNVWYRMLWTSAPTPARGMWRIMRRWTTKQNRRRQGSRSVSYTHLTLPTTPYV